VCLLMPLAANNRRQEALCGPTVSPAVRPTVVRCSSVNIYWVCHGVGMQRSKVKVIASLSEIKCTVSLNQRNTHRLTAVRPLSEERRHTFARYGVQAHLFLSSSCL